MLKNKAYKFRIYPNQKQMELIEKTFGCTRFVFNYFLEKSISMYKEEKKTLRYKDYTSMLVEIKKEKEFLKEVDSISLQQSLRHLDAAYSNFFKNKETRFPKFKSKKNDKSYTTVTVNNNIKIEDKYITLPKLGKVKIKKHRLINKEEIIKSVVVSRVSNKYYVSLVVTYEAKETIYNKQELVIGLDYSMDKLFVSSDKEYQTNKESLHNYKKYEDKLALYQRRLSKCMKQSKRYLKQKAKINKIHEKIKNKRKDYLHKESRKIANFYDVVVIESLDMKKMSSSNLKLGKGIFDNGWGMFTNYLKYKLEDQGKRLIKIDKYYPSSKLCSSCKHIHTELKLNERTWICPECGTKHNRDYNAAINIKKEGLRLLKV